MPVFQNNMLDYTFKGWVRKFVRINNYFKTSSNLIHVKLKTEIAVHEHCCNCFFYTKYLQATPQLVDLIMFLQLHTSVVSLRVKAMFERLSQLYCLLPP